MATERFLCALTLTALTIMSSPQPANAFVGEAGGAVAAVAAVLTLKKNAEDISSGLSLGARRQLEAFIRGSVEPLIDRIDAGISANIRLAGYESRKTATHAARELELSLVSVINAAEEAAASRTAAADQALANRISQATTALHGLLDRVNDDLDRVLCRVMPTGKFEVPFPLFGMPASKRVWRPRGKRCWAGENINNAWVVETFTGVHWARGRLCELDEQIAALDLTSTGSWGRYTSLLLEAAKVSEIGRCEGRRLAGTTSSAEPTATVFLRLRMAYQSRLEDIYSVNQLMKKYATGDDEP